MQKTTDGSPLKSSLADFGFVVDEIGWPDEETQEVATREWPGIDGEDAYISPSGQKLQAYDLDVKFLYKGNIGTANAKYKALRNYLRGTGGFLKIYDLYWNRGRQGVYVKKFGDLEPFRTNIDEGVAAKITFRVTDPVSEVIAATDEDGVIIGLGAAL